MSNQPAITPPFVGRAIKAMFRLNMKKAAVKGERGRTIPRRDMRLTRRETEMEEADRLRKVRGEEDLTTKSGVKV